MEEPEKEMSETKLPGNEILKNAVKISIAEDRPILLDYWASSLNKKCFISLNLVLIQCYIYYFIKCLTDIGKVCFFKIRMENTYDKLLFSNSLFDFF